MSAFYAFCSVSLSPLRSKAEDSSEMVSQLVFGETIEVLEKLNQWRRVKSLVDNYEGWLDEKCISELSKEEKTIWEGIRKPMFNTICAINSAEGMMHLTRGAYVSNGKFKIGKNDYELQQQTGPTPSNLVEIVKAYKNAPYLWGGKTVFGIDCSGLTQMTFRFFGIELMRDADLQAREGKEVTYSERRPGDLAFFINSKEKIHHVGVIINDKEIIHAHGWVRMDEMDENGILGRSDVKYSHKLAFIKRYE